MVVQLPGQCVGAKADVALTFLKGRSSLGR